jgi:hypothetical protein
VHAGGVGYLIRAWKGLFELSEIVRNQMDTATGIVCLEKIK